MIYTLNLPLVSDAQLRTLSSISTNTVWETFPKYNGSGEEREFVIVLGSNNLVVVTGVMPS